MIVAADHFDLQAKLGFLLRPFLGTIEAEVSKQLDEALAKEAAKSPRPAKPVARPVAKAPAKKK
jgi:hypothetical protein